MQYRKGQCHDGHKIGVSKSAQGISAVVGSSGNSGSPRTSDMTSLVARILISRSDFLYNDVIAVSEDGRIAKNLRHLSNMLASQNHFHYRCMLRLTPTPHLCKATSDLALNLRPMVQGTCLSR